MPFLPDHPDSVSAVNITPNGTGTGDSVRYEVDSSGTLVEIRQSATGQGTHMRFIYDVPGLANAAQNRFTNLMAQGSTGANTSQNTTTVGITVDANGIRAVNQAQAQAAQVQQGDTSVDSPMAYREVTASGTITPPNASPPSSRPASPMDQTSPIRPLASTLNRPPVSIFGSMSINNQPTRYDGPSLLRHGHLRPNTTQEQQEQQRRVRASTIELGHQLQNLQRHESQIRLNIDRLQEDIRRERDQVQLEESQYRMLVYRAREAREKLQIAIRSLDAVRMEQMQLEQQARRRQQEEDLTQIGSDDVGDLYVEDDEDHVQADETPHPPPAPTRSTFQRFVTPSPASEGGNNTLHAGFTPRTPCFLSPSPSPPGELHVAQRMRFSNHFTQAHALTPASPTPTDPDGSHAPSNHSARYMSPYVTRRSAHHRNALQEQPTELIDFTGVPMYHDKDQHRFFSEAPSDDSNFSTATTESIKNEGDVGMSPSTISPGSMSDIHRAHAIYKQRLRILPTTKGDHYVGGQTPTNSIPLRSIVDTAPPVIDTSARQLSSEVFSATGPGKLYGPILFPFADGKLTTKQEDKLPSVRVVVGHPTGNLSSLSSLTSLSTMVTSGSTAAVERIISVQPDSPPQAGPGPSTQAARYRGQSAQSRSHTGVTTRSQAKKQAINSGKTEDTSDTSRGKGKGRD